MIYIFTQIWLANVIINYLKLKNCSQFIFVYQKSLKRTFQTGFSAQNPLLNLCSSAVNSQKLFCSQKDGVKCLYSSFLVYKLLFF